MSKINTRIDSYICMETRMIYDKDKIAISRKFPVNNLCPCNSGLKFKKCCRDLQKLVEPKKNKRKVSNVKKSILLASFIAMTGCVDVEKCKIPSDLSEKAINHLVKCSYEVDTGIHSIERCKCEVLGVYGYDNKQKKNLFNSKTRSKQ